jgi:hypothetical protein
MNRLTAAFPTTIRPIEDKLRSLMETDFPKVFNIYTAIDMYDFCSKLLHYLEDKTIKANLDLLRHIVRIAEHYLTNILVKVVNNPEIQVESPILKIMKECFVNRIIDPKIPQPNMHVVDIWQFDRGMKYNTENYKSFPPWLKELQLMTKDGKVKPHPYFRAIEEGWLRYSKYRRDAMAMVHYIAERHRLKYA